MLQGACSLLQAMRHETEAEVLASRHLPTCVAVVRRYMQVLCCVSLTLAGKVQKKEVKKMASGRTSNYRLSLC